MCRTCYLISKRNIYFVWDRVGIISIITFLSYIDRYIVWMPRKNKSFSHENDVTTFREDQSTDTHWTWVKYSYCCTSRWPANAFISTSFLPYLIFNNHPFNRINGHGNIEDEVLFVPNIKSGNKRSRRNADGELYEIKSYGKNSE